MFDYVRDLARFLTMPPRQQAYALGLVKRIRSGRHYLGSSGYWRSNLEGRSVDSKGNPLPWMNYGAIALLQERLDLKMRVFEYGSGGSSVFFARHSAQVTCVEHDKAFADYVRGFAIPNLEVLDASDRRAEYASAISGREGPYEIVVVDGLHRLACVEAALGSLTNDGIVIVDDTQEAEFALSLTIMANLGFKHLGLQGLKPQSHAAARTSFFYRDANVFGL